MKRLLALCTGVATTLAILAGPALAKGEARNASGSLLIAGPGLSGPIEISGVLTVGAYGTGIPEGDAGVFSSFVVGAGLVPTGAGYFGEKPEGSLGPRYVMTTSVDAEGVTSIHQDLYPYATGGPVFFNPPGQTGVYGDMLVSSWWYPPSSFLGLLTSHGLPVTAPRIPAPAARPAPAPQPIVDGGNSRIWAFLALIGGLVLLLVAGAVVGRQRMVRAG
jgi:hypothetical protein